MISILKQLIRDVRGNILFMGAASMPVFIGAAGLATDTIMWALWSRETQRAADSAALAGALTLQQAVYEAEKAALHDFKKSKAFKDLKGKIVVEWPPKKGNWSEDNNAVRVIISVERVLPFSNFFMKKAPMIQNEATATLAHGVENCVLALDRDSSAAIAFTGTSSSVFNCGVMTNSTNSQAVVADGNSYVAALAVSAVGGVAGKAHYTDSTELRPYSTPIVDPWKLVEQPKVPKPCNPKVSVDANQSATIRPGCYAGMSINGNVKLDPGVYYITSEDFAAASTATLSGEGVTIFLLNDPAGKRPYFPQLRLDGQANVQLSAPQSGVYQDLLFFQDRGAPYLDRTPNFIAGNSNTKLRGDLYFPNQKLSLAGTMGLTLDCFRMVARRVTFTGRSELTGGCSSSPRYARRNVRLVA